MAAVTTANSLLELVRKSGLVEPARLDAYLQTAPVRDDAETPRKLAERLVRDGLLTVFQAQQLLKGKHKGFLISGKYRLLELLGTGGMGQVYLCEHAVMRRLVALKVLPVTLTTDEASVQRFHREARASAALDHPNIVRAFDVDRDGKLHFLVMEYVDGTSLQHIVKQHGPMDITRACHYVSQAAEGLEHAHECGLVHRDIKPGNLLLDRSGTIKILDMGLALFFLEAERESLTEKYEGSVVLGTADYLAPEQALNSHKVDIRADVYSLGATFYYLLTGQSPFSGTSVAQKLIMHQVRVPDPVTMLRPDVPPELEKVVKRMMAKDPAKRYQTPAEVVAALAKWTATPIDPPPDAEMPRRSAAVVNLSQGSPSQGAPGSTGRLKRTRPESAKTVKAEPAPSALPRRKFPAVTAAAIGAAAVVLAGVVGGVWWVMQPGGTPTRTAAVPPAGPAPVTRTGPVPEPVRTVPAQPANVTPPRFVVSRGEVKNLPAGAKVVPVLDEAVKQSRPGDRILVLDPAIAAVMHLDGNGPGKGVTVESGLGGGQRVVWGPPEGHDPAEPLIKVHAVEGLCLRGFAVHGNRDQVETLVAVSGSCPDFRLENAELAQFKRRAVSLRGAGGTPEKPLTISRTRFRNDWKNARVAIEMVGGEHVHVQDSTFDGLFDALLTIDGRATDIDFVRNRVHAAYDQNAPWTADGVVVQSPATQPVRLRIDSNTVSRLNHLLRFRTAPATDGSTQVVVRNNLIIGAHELVGVDEPGADENRLRPAFPDVTYNVTRPGAVYVKGGLFRSQLVRVPFGYLTIDPEKDQVHLRYKKEKDKDNPLPTAGVGGGPVGVPPLDQ